MIDVNLKYDCKLHGWQRGSLRLVMMENALKRRKWGFRTAKSLGIAALVLWMVGLGVIAVPAAPYVLYKVMPGTTTRVARVLGTTAEVERSAFGEEMYVAPQSLPPLDESLTAENRIVIEKIGLNALIGEGEEWEEVLKEGPWRMSEFGEPGDVNDPVIIASHRYGYLAWTNQFRRERSFYNLPKVEVGDRVEIVWNQRKFTYEIYEGYTDTVIREGSYEADLILYTCELLNSDRRIIRLGRLVSN